MWQSEQAHVLPETPKLDRATELAIMRTRAAFDRTMMAWIRTATSLITFGFSIYKFFQLEEPKRFEVPHHLIGPRQFAMMLVIIGLISLLLAAVEYRHNIATLRVQGGRDQRSLSLLVATLISMLGIVALFLVVFRQ
jgi:putative membrane protein